MLKEEVFVTGRIFFFLVNWNVRLGLFFLGVSVLVFFWEFGVGVCRVFFRFGFKGGYVF